MYKPKTKEYMSEKGNTFTFQTVLPCTWAEIMDRLTDKNGKILFSKSMPEMLKHVVVQPQGLKMDDFETWEELEEVTQAAFQFQRIGE